MERGRIVVASRAPMGHAQMLGGGPHNLPHEGGLPFTRSDPVLLNQNAKREPLNELHVVVTQPGTSGEPATPVAVAFPAMQRVRDTHRYARVLEASTPVANGQSAMFLSQPTGNRNMLMFRNTAVAGLGAPNIYISYGQNASLLSIIKLLPGDFMLLSEVVPQDDLYAYADAAAAVLAYGYSVIPSV